MDSSAAEDVPSPAMAKGKRKRDKAEQGEKKTSKRHRSKSKLRTSDAEAAVLPKAEDDETSMALVKTEVEEESDAEEQALVPAAALAATWKISEPMGGRLADVEPILSQDEKYIVLAYETSIQVYSTEDSLLVRRIPIGKPLRNRSKSHSKSSGAPRVSAAVPSLIESQVVWVADDWQVIWKVNWETGDAAIHTKSGSKVSAMQAINPTGSKDQELLLTSENSAKGTSQLVAYATASGRADRYELNSCPGDVHILRATADGCTVVGAMDARLLIAKLRLEKDSTNAFVVSSETYVLEAPDDVCSLDVKLGSKKTTSTPKKPKSKQNSGAAEAGLVLDVVVGTVRGSIYAYNDVLSHLQKSGSIERIQPRQYHWHPRAVHSVKWSLDGEYFISGGTENTLVLWQVDTGRREYLPHLSACVNNIVVSPLGSSYAITLDDNSAMILSTSEMTPTTYISGLQSLVLSGKKKRDKAVRRVWKPVEQITRPLTAAINPKEPTRLYLSVGNGQSAMNTDSTPSASSVQVFDFSTFQSLSKQPLARTNPTENNITPKGYPVTEPWVSHMSFSHQGDWLASVDEWQPPVRDLEPIAEDKHAAESLSQERKEIHLKFWKVGAEGSGQMELISRIDEAHFSTRPESILSLAASPRTSLFSTVGADGKVRLWGPFSQQSSKTPANALVAKGKGAQVATETVEGWTCVQEIPLASNTSITEIEVDSADEPLNFKPSGASTFSDDGSTLFVAYGLPDEVVLYIIDASSGRIRNRVNQLFEGEVRSLQILGSCLIILAGSVVVYDVVEDTIRYNVTFDDPNPNLKLQMTQLAVDKRSKTFALAVPVFYKSDKPSYKKGVVSEVAVFTLEEDRPVLVQAIPNLVISLLAVPGSAGFVAVDSAAHVLAVIQATAMNPLAAPLSDLQLDKVPDNNDQDAMEVDDEDEADSNRMLLQLSGTSDAMDEDNDADDMEDMETHNAILVPEKLTQIFDGAPAFALPPIEDLFYQVSELISSKPVSSSA
ncbi:hypothetical protein MCOR25_004218 [Pyricularia grisea]|nr:hypothetical protein MCOR25_004218 [Pyricularia grisea]